MDSMSPPPSHGNPTTFGGLINTSLSQGVLLTAGGRGTSQDSLQGCGSIRIRQWSSLTAFPIQLWKAEPLQPAACIANSRADVCSFLS